MENELILKDVYKQSPDGVQLLNSISLNLSQGTKLSVLGPSGSGKTTLLRIIAGLESFDSGTLFFNGCSMKNIPPHKRNFGMMFQDYALFPHMNVFDNIAFGLKMKGLNKPLIESRVKLMLEMTGLANFEYRHIDELSGGERQRIALARTLAPEPGLLMLDEPLSSLDRAMRTRLLTELTQIIARLKITTIFVTHDHEEAFAAGNRVIIMNQGKIEQQGTREELVNSPKNQWVKDFLGMV